MNLAQNHVKSYQVTKGNTPGDELSFTTKVTGRSGIQISDPFGDRRLIH